jgi:hypothetical protein
VVVTNLFPGAGSRVSYNAINPVIAATYHAKSFLQQHKSTLTATKVSSSHGGISCIDD